MYGTIFRMKVKQGQQEENQQRCRLQTVPDRLRLPRAHSEARARRQGSAHRRQQRLRSA